MNDGCPFTGFNRAGLISLLFSLLPYSTQLTFDWTTELMPLCEGSSYRPIKRRGRSTFVEGECWGYDRFYPIAQLEPEGFIDRRDGSLLLRFAVRPATFSLQQSLQAGALKEAQKKVSVATNRKDIFLVVCPHPACSCIFLISPLALLGGRI